MEDYRHILAAVDYSASGEAAARRAAGLSRVLSAELTLLHVVEHFPEDMPVDTVAPEDADPTGYREGVWEARLAELASQLRVKDADTRVVFSKHSAKYEIQRVAEQVGADVIVLGARGHHMVRRLIGSTAADLVYRAPCDVVVVRPEDERAAG